MEWDDLRHFAAFVASGSLSGAARTLGIEHATVARRIASLEARLKLKLVDRRGRRLVLTPEGEKVAALAERMAETSRAVERLADGARSELRGQVTVSAPPAYATLVLASRLAPLRTRHPDLLVRLLGEAHTASLERREADIVVRLSRPEAGDLTAVRIGSMPFHLYASPQYLAVTTAAEWTFIGSAGAMTGSPQQAILMKIAGKDGFGFLSDQIEIQAALAAAGGGIALLPEFVALARADLVRVQAGEPLATREVWLAVHSDLRNAAPIRAVIETLREEQTPVQQR
jgi:DNA-binding transcriptional LysR family regulator